MNRKELEKKLEEVKAQVKEIEEELQKGDSKENKPEIFWNGEIEYAKCNNLFAIDCHGDVVYQGKGGDFTSTRLKDGIEKGVMSISKQYMQKKALHDKILNELYLFSESKNDLVENMELVKKDKTIIYSIFYGYEGRRIEIGSASYYSTEWIAFKTRSVAEEALELFREDLEQYYSMEW